MPERNKGSSRLHFSEEKAEAKVEKVAARAEKIRTNIPKKKTVSITRATDEATGKTRLRLHLEEKPKPAPSFHSMGVMRLPLAEVHHQIGKVEEKNTGVEAAHHGEEAAEKTARFAGIPIVPTSSSPTGSWKKLSRSWTRPTSARCSRKLRFPAIPSPAGGRNRLSEKPITLRRQQVGRTRCCEHFTG